MGMGMDNVGIQAGVVNSIQPQTEVKKAEQVQIKDYPNDSVEFTTSNKGEALTKEEKQEKILEARTTAAGWSCLGGIISTACYALRSDEKVAEKFGLDAQKDKDLIKEIKKQQVTATLPAAAGTLLFGVGTLATGGATWIYNKYFCEPSQIKVE